MVKICVLSECFVVGCRSQCVILLILGISSISLFGLGNSFCEFVESKMMFWILFLQNRTLAGRTMWLSALGCMHKLLGSVCHILLS